MPENIEGGIKFCIQAKDVTISAENWDAKQIADFFAGLAKVVSACMGQEAAGKGDADAAPNP